MKGPIYLSATLLALWVAGGMWASAAQTGAVAGKEPGSAARRRLPAATTPGRPASSLVISLHSGGELALMDSEGRRTGFNPDNKMTLSEIPHASYGDDSIDDASDDSAGAAGTDEKTLDLRPPQPGSYTLTVYGTGNGAYDLELHSTSGTVSHPRTVLAHVPASVGSRHSYSLTVPSGGGPVEVSGGFGGSQDKGSERLLTYASPLAGESNLPTGTTSFPIIIFYGAQAIPSTFSAVLNGVSITASFHPGVRRFEIVPLRLRPGRNVLELGMAGSAGENVNHRLVFSVGP